MVMINLEMIIASKLVNILFIKHVKRNKSCIFITND